MTDGFDDGLHEKGVNHSYIKEIPKKKTAVALKNSEGCLLYTSDAADE